MAFVYEKISEEEKENLKIKLIKAENKIKEIDKSYDSLFGKDGFIDYYEFPDVWIIDRENRMIFVQYGFCDHDSSIEMPFNYYCLYVLFFENEIIVTSLFEDLAPKGLFIDIDEIYIPCIFRYSNIDFFNIIKQAFMEKYPNKNVFCRFLCNINFI